MVLHGALVATGVALLVWGLPAAHRLEGMASIFAATAVLAGTLLALIGTLLVAVPDFFKG
jgi:hypothetical protein